MLQGLNNTSGDPRTSYTNNTNTKRARKARITAKLSIKAALEAGGVIFILHYQKNTISNAKTSYTINMFINMFVCLRISQTNEH
jgi:hypothetical protein